MFSIIQLYCKQPPQWSCGIPWPFIWRHNKLLLFFTKLDILQPRKQIRCRVKMYALNWTKTASVVQLRRYVTTSLVWSWQNLHHCQSMWLFWLLKVPQCLPSGTIYRLLRFLHTHILPCVPVAVPRLELDLVPDARGVTVQCGVSCSPCELEVEFLDHEGKILEADEPKISPEDDGSFNVTRRLLVPAAVNRFEFALELCPTHPLSCLVCLLVCSHWDETGDFNDWSRQFWFTENSQSDSLVTASWTKHGVSNCFRVRNKRPQILSIWKWWIDNYGNRIKSGNIFDDVTKGSVILKKHIGFSLLLLLLSQKRCHWRI